MNLNNEQLLAAKHVDGPMLVVAGPGSGKTRLLVERIKYLIEESYVSPNNILVITFSKKAAIEMQQRFLNATLNNSYSVVFGTFHSIFFHIIQNHSHTKDSLLEIKDKIEYIKFSGLHCGVKDANNKEWQLNTLELISSYKNIGDEIFNKIPGCYMTDLDKEEFLKVFQYYSNLCREESKIDFDDMILRCLELLKKNTSILKFYQNRFQYILIDEFQDINQSQYEIIKLLAGSKSNIFCVGDDDQSIYGFRGAFPNIMKHFLSDYPALKTAYLGQNYRSGADIISLSNKIINDNKNRIMKQSVPINQGGTIMNEIFDTRKDEEIRIIDILTSFNSDYRNDTAIILRTNNEVGMYIGLLKKHNIDVYEYGFEADKVYKSFIFNDILAFLKFIYEDNLREYFITFMNKPNKYIKRLSLVNDRIYLEDLLIFYDKDVNMKHELTSFFNKIKLASNMKKIDLAINIFVKTIGYEKYLISIAKNPTLRLDYLDIVNKVINIFKKYDFSMSLDEYAEMIIKDKPSNNVSINKGVHVITMHGSKGLEFDTVIVPDVNEGIMPPKNLNEDSIEEERRLFYVAITRAKNNLYIFATKERNREISRFIKGKI